MDTQILIAFAGTAVAESLTPGPTIALVLDTRMRSGKGAALRTIAGITLANVAWVAVALLVAYWDLAWTAPGARDVISMVAVPILMYLVCVRILTASVMFVSRRSHDVTPTTGHSGVFTGFVVHALNPLSPAFYLATFLLVIKGAVWSQALMLGAVPVLMDIIIFGTMAGLTTPVKEEHFPAGLLQLLSGVLLFMIVTKTLNDVPGGVSSGAGGVGVILVALLAAALQVALRLARSFKGAGKVLWRVVGLWDSWFKVAAVCGAIVSLSAVVGGLPAVDQRIRVISVVAAVIAAALSFAKASGDLQEEWEPSTAPMKIPDTAWQAKPIPVGFAALGFLAAIYVLIWSTGFSLSA